MGQLRTESEGADASPSWRQRLLGFVPTILRNAAYAGLFGGFLGALVAGESPVSPDSIYGVVFLTGAACGIVSIYLAMLLQERELA